MTEAEVAQATGGFVAHILPDSWKAIPAAVLALLAFGFRRMTARLLGLFARIEDMDGKMTRHMADTAVSFRLNEQARVGFTTALADHSARSTQATERVERALETQARRIDDIAGRKG